MKKEKGELETIDHNIDKNNKYKTMKDTEKKYCNEYYRKIDRLLEKRDERMRMSWKKINADINLTKLNYTLWRP